MGRRAIRGCKKVPLAWKNLYLGTVHRNSKAAGLNSECLEKMSISLDEKEQDASEYVQREMDAKRARRYMGSVATDSVTYTTSPGGDQQP